MPVSWNFVVNYVSFFYLQTLRVKRLKTRMSDEFDRSWSPSCKKNEWYER